MLIRVLLPFLDHSLSINVFRGFSPLVRPSIRQSQSRSRGGDHFRKFNSQSRTNESGAGHVKGGWFVYSGNLPYQTTGNNKLAPTILNERLSQQSAVSPPLQ